MNVGSLQHLQRSSKPSVFKNCRQDHKWIFVFLEVEEISEYLYDIKDWDGLASDWCQWCNFKAPYILFFSFFHDNEQQLMARYYDLTDDLLLLLTVLCNSSIWDGVLPASQKRSILVPILKCEGLDTSNPVNFRPIANVSFISKVVEKVVALQLTLYLVTNNLLPTIQSGFRKGHSTETLLLRLLSDIYGAIDRSKLTLSTVWC